MTLAIAICSHLLKFPSDYSSHNGRPCNKMTVSHTLCRILAALCVPIVP